MTQTAPPDTASPARERVETWLSDFDAALAARDAGPGRGPVRDQLLLARPGLVHLEPHDRRGPRGRRRPARAHAGPRRRRAASSPSEPPDEADGVVTAWFAFETAAGRGTGLLRLVQEDGEDGVDAAHHALRAQGPRGAARHPPADGRRARRRQAPADLEGARAGRRPRASAAPPSRTCWSIGGGQGGIALGARLRQLGVPTPRHRQAPAARRPVAQPLQVAVPARPGLVRPPALPEVPRQLAGLRAQGQDRRLARVVHAGDGGALLVEHRGHRAPPGRRRRRSGPSRSSARASR